MGLLDDAIREHLELKRLRGADPTEVARQEHEALGPVYRDGTADDHDSGEAPEPQDAAGSFFADPEPSVETVLPAAGQETTEIDMGSVLDMEQEGPHPYQELLVGDQDPGQGPAPVGHPAHTHHPEESLEWEVPAGHDDYGQEEGVTGDDEHDAESHVVDDVLEETPDFLRDTPDEDRLWFEQRPPRDFDFNE